jgi:undecaprenyl diphosphate synthase
MTVTELKTIRTDQVVPPPPILAIIMDGNGRWAQARGLPREEGHREGAKVVRNITEYCREAGVKTLYLYAFSEQNWCRPPEEIAALMGLLEEFLIEEIPTMLENGIRLGVIGDPARLPEETRAALARALEATRSCTEMNLVLSLSYGGREELVRAAVRLAKTGLAPEQWRESSLANQLDTAPYGDPDLLIRTGGEMRLSNFLLWQCSYCELHFSQTPWPAFEREELRDIFALYVQRQRRFGQTPGQVWAKERVR